MKVRAPTYADEQLAFLTWYNLNVQYFFYVGVLGFIVLFAFLNALYRLLSAALVRRFHTLRPPLGSDGGGRVVGAATATGAAVVAAYRKWVYRRSQVVQWLGFENAAQLFVFLSYSALTLSLVFSGALGHPDYSAHHAARLTYAHLPLLVGLASKELGVVGWLTGLSPATLNCFHRWMARVVFFLACWHVYGRFYTNLPTIQPFARHYRYQAWGLFGFVLWTLMTFGSTRFIRRKHFKTFLFLHLVCFCFSIICLALHIPRLGPYLIASAVIYLSDRLVRLSSTIWFSLLRSVGRGIGPSARIELVGPDAFKLRITTSRRWTPGTHLYLHCPMLEAGGHPFSIASTFLPVSHLNTDPVPKAGEYTLCVRVHGGLTAKLQALALEGAEAQAYSAEETKHLTQPVYPVFTEGPYGHRLLLHRYESVLLVSGGTGVAYTLPLLLDLVRRARNKHLGGHKPLVTQRCTFVWTVRHVADVDLVADELREASAYAPPGFLDVQVYVTGVGGSSAGSSYANLASSASANSSAYTLGLGLTATQSIEYKPSASQASAHLNPFDQPRYDSLSASQSRLVLANPDLPAKDNSHETLDTTLVGSSTASLPRKSSLPPHLASHAPDTPAAPTTASGFPVDASAPGPPAPQPVGVGSTLPSPASAPSVPPSLSSHGHAFPTPSGPSTAYLPLHPGRPPIRALLADLVARTPRSGSVAAASCGPVALTDELGAACADTIDVGRVRRGEHRLNVMFHAEVFGW
ncbi:hypothetical protein JCM10207_003579 [Rhodosporidiobolus poonsookiae]